MALARPGRERERLGVIPMALALVLAALLGAALGFVWQNVSFGGKDDAAKAKASSSQAQESSAQSGRGGS